MIESYYRWYVFAVSLLRKREYMNVYSPCLNMLPICDGFGDVSVEFKRKQTSHEQESIQGWGAALSAPPDVSRLFQASNPDVAVAPHINQAWIRKAPTLSLLRLNYLGGAPAIEMGRLISFCGLK